MKFVTRCVFLKLTEGKSKSGKYYMNIDLLDDDNNSHKFFIFNEDLQTRLKNEKLEGLKTRLDIAFEVYETQDSWGVRVLDFKKVDENNGNSNNR